MNSTRLFAFDMDGTLIEPRSIIAIGKIVGKEHEIASLLAQPHDVSDAIARLLIGSDERVFQKAYRKISLVPGARRLIRILKRSGFRVGIISDGYFQIAKLVEKDLGTKLDFIEANRFRVRNGKLVSLQKPCRIMDDNWKGRVLGNVARKFGYRLSQCVAAGDNLHDIGMFRKAGLSVAYNPKKPEVAGAADLVIQDYFSLLSFLR